MLESKAKPRSCLRLLCFFDRLFSRRLSDAGMVWCSLLKAQKRRKTSELQRQKTRGSGLRILPIENAPLTSFHRNYSTLEQRQDFGKQLSRSFAVKALWAWIAYGTTCNVIVYLFRRYCSYIRAHVYRGPARVSAFAAIETVKMYVCINFYIYTFVVYSNFYSFYVSSFKRIKHTILKLIDTF